MSIDKLPAAPQHPGASDDERAEAARHVAKSRSGNWLKDHKGITAATSAVAGVALAAAVGMGLKGGGSNEAPRNVPTATAVETTPPITTPETSLSDQRIGEKGELLAQDFYELYNEWTNAGIGKNEIDKVVEANLSSEEYAKLVNAPIDEQYISLMFVSDWQSNPNLVSTINDIIEIHRDNSRVALATSDPDNGDAERYRREMIFETSELIRNDADGVVIATRQREYDNRDKNRAGQFLTADPNTFPEGGGTITFVKTPEGLRISDIFYNAG